MVTATVIDEHLAHFKEQKHSGKVAVFVGATNGIGEATLNALASILDKSTLYIIGRSASRFETQRNKLQTTNPVANIVFLEAEISLIKNVDEACRQIKGKESKVDYLCMSAGYLPFNGAEYTSEGLEVCMTLSYYARMRFIQNLLPLLGGGGRVLSILAGGREGKLVEDDFGLEKSWSMGTVMNQTTTLTTLALSYLAQQNRNIAFIHAFPGLVKTDIAARQPIPRNASFLWRFSVGFLRWGMGFLMSFMAITPDNSAKRFVYQLTDERFSEGGKIWRLDEFCEAWGEGTAGSKVVKEYEDKGGWGERVWEKALEK